MDKLFDIEGPFIQFLNRVADLMILNFLVIFCCIPVVTAGAAFTAEHYVLLKMARREDGYIVKGFFKSFKENFKQATILWLIMLVLAAFYAVDFYIIRNADVEFTKIFLVLFLAIAFICIFTGVYVFPLLSHFNNSIKNILRNALSISMLNIPKTLMIIAVYVIPFVWLYFSDFAFVIIFLFGASLPAYAAAMIYSGIFKKYEPENKEIVSDYDFSVKMDEGNEENE